MSNGLVHLAPDLSIATRQFSNELGRVTSRMTVMRLNDQSVVIHSPVPIEPNLRAEVESLGQPTALIAPNLFHHQFVPEWRSAFPAARAFCTPGLERKRTDIKFDGVLDDVSPAEWRGQIDQLLIEGVPRYSDMVFFHRRSRTLIVCDIVFNYSPEQAADDPGAVVGLGPHDRIKYSITDPNALRDSIDSVLRWPFERVVLSHGQIVESDGNARMRDAFAFLKRVD